MANDEWRVVEDYPDYFINRDGEVKRRLRTGRKPLVKSDSEGYMTFTFIDADGRHERRIVDIVKQTFPE